MDVCRPLLGGGQNVFSAFYDRLKDVRNYHKHYPGFHAPTADDFLAPFKTDLPAGAYCCPLFSST